MKNKKIFIIITVIAILVIAIVSVFFWPEKERKLQVSQSELKEVKKRIQIDIQRYDQDLFGMDMNQLNSEVLKLAEKYPTYLIDKNICTSPELLAMLQNYLTDPVIKDIYQKVQQQYPNLNPFENDLQQAFSYYLIYFPNQKIPKIITIIPGIDLQMPSVYIFDEIVYVNLDMYLGTTCSHYQKLGIPKYISERFESKYLTVDIFKKAIVYKHLPEQEPTTFIENMIIEGKKLYFTEMMLPKTPLQDIIGYSEEKYQWAENFYPNVWGYIVEQQKLFSKDDDVVRIFIEESPFTKPFGNRSPGRMGQFLGWKIVKEYMKNNPEVTLEQLMQTKDLQIILNRSAFKPMIKK